MPIPTLTTGRLRLTPFTPEDVPEVARMAGDRAIADTTLNIPHPYSEKDAEGWVGTHAKRHEEGKVTTFAIRLTDGPLVGAMGIVISKAMKRAELGYWIGREHWNRGYATEAARAVLDHAFGTLGLRRVFAEHLVRNPASGRVMEKLGMREEGILRGHVLKWDVPEDIAFRGILREEWERFRGSP
jgi:RimJ/RimL family protein N-acetyltransferase